MNKNTVYILQKDYEYPNGKVYKGVGHTIKEWQRYFPYLIGRDFDIKTDWFKPKEEPKKLDKEKEFQKVLKCLKNNKVVVDTREDGIYTRLAGRESDGEAFTLHFALAYPFPKGKPKEEVNESKPTEQFQWTNELVMEFVNFHDEQKGIHWLSEDIEKFKQSKSKKEEPQWEILEFQSNDGNLLVLDGKKWKYRNDTNSISDIDFLIKNYAIHSVKRLSDGEVFSVGDSLDWMGKIESIEIDDRFNGGIAFINNSQKSCISTAKKAPKEEQVPIKVEIMEFGYGKPQENKGKFYVANFNLPNNAKLPTEKYQSIKSAIEDVINNKYKPWKMYLTGFTSEELLQARRDAFDAAKISTVTYGNVHYKYHTFEDYINSLK